MKYSTKINSTETDGVEITFEEVKSGLIKISFEGGTEDADAFLARLGDALSEYKGMLADSKRREQLKRDRTARLDKLTEQREAFYEAQKEAGTDVEWDPALQNELDHLTELKNANEL